MTATVVSFGAVVPLDAYGVGQVWIGPSVGRPAPHPQLRLGLSA